MPGFLLDTNVISGLAPDRSDQSGFASEDFHNWVVENEQQIFLSVITIAEIQAGIAALERRRATRRASALSQWLEALFSLYGNKVLPFTPAIALLTGTLLDKAIGSGIDPGFEDAAIAATAKFHDLTIVTNNLRHFQHFAVALKR